MKAEKPIVVLRRWTEFSRVGHLLEQAISDLGGLERFVHPGQTVVIKPNLTANAPANSGGTTHVELVDALVGQVQRCHPGRIIIAEGNGYFGTTLETAFPTGGWREMAARRGIELYNLDGGPYADISLENPRYPYPIPFSRLILDADAFISVPCLKTHISADYTVALKNSYALPPQWKRSEIHRQYLLEESLVDLNRIRKPDLVVVDGWDGAEGIAGGVAFDRPAHARVLLVGDDPVAVDAVSREIMGLTAPTRYLDWAIEEGVGIGDLAQIRLRGDSLDDCRHPFMSPADEILDLMPGLAIHDQRACSGCRIPALAALHRFSRQKLLQPIEVILGGEGGAPQVTAKTLVIGRCAKDYSHLGIYIEGCPPSVQTIVERLESMGCICRQCRDTAQEVLAEFPGSFLSRLRVTAAGAQVHIGSQVKRGEWHLELLVGDCSERYARAVFERAAQFGMDTERDILWLKGCPVDAPAIREGLARLSQVPASPTR